MTKKIEEPHIDPVPPPTGWALVWKFLKNWQSIFLFAPAALCSIWAFAQFGYFLTGRRPTENVDYIVGISGNLVKMVFLVVFCEIVREQTGHWYTKEQIIEYPEIARTQAFTQCVTLIVGAYLLSH